MKQLTSPGQLGQHRCEVISLRGDPDKRLPQFMDQEVRKEVKRGRLRVESSQTGEKCLQASPSFSMKEALTEELEMKEPLVQGLR